MELATILIRKELKYILANFYQHASPININLAPPYFRTHNTFVHVEKDDLKRHVRSEIPQARVCCTCFGDID